MRENRGEEENKRGAFFLHPTFFTFVRRQETLTRQTDWRGIALSATGDIMVAVIDGDRIWRSLNRGASWEEALAPVDNYWAVATSANGSTMVAVSGQPDDHIIGRIYRSVDTGEEGERGDVEFWLGPITPFPPLFPPKSAGRTWQRTSAPQDVWSGVASTADGSVFVASTWNGGIFISRDAGQSWTKSSAPDEAFKGVSMSADGVKIAACVDGGTVWRSADAGVSWQATGMSYNEGFRYEDIAMSANGSQIATVYYGSDGFVWLTYTGGDVWVTPGGPHDKRLERMTASADGSKMALSTSNLSPIGTVDPDRISTSSDSGLTWRESLAPLQYWGAIASSTDMVRLVALASGAFLEEGRIWVSTDSGIHWRETQSRYTMWYDVASSADGVIYSACIKEDRIWTSPNGGDTWHEADAPQADWRGIAGSADMVTQVAVNSAMRNANGDFRAPGSIWISYNSGRTWSKVPDTDNDWRTVAMSSDGRLIAAGAYNNTAAVFTSVDRGKTWTLRKTQYVEVIKSSA